MKVDSVERINKEISESEFLREAFLRLSLETDTPADILESQFGKVENFENQYLQVKAETNCTYSCSVGYDRNVTYYENGKQKTKTVTDWQPFSGTNSSTELVYVGNADSQDDYPSTYKVASCVSACKEESFVKVDEQVEVNPSALEYAKQRCIASCFYRVDLPGDRQKDKNYSGVANVKAINVAYIPEYKMEYKYNGENYLVKGFACGDTCMNETYPSIASDVEKQTKKKLKPLKLAGFITAGVALIMSMIPGLLDISMLPWFGAIGVLIAYFIRKKKLKSQALTLLRQEKRLKLIDMLKEKNMKALTSEEVERFDKVIK